MACLAKSPSAMSTWQRPQMPRPPQTESRSTPSARAASSRLAPSPNSPRLPEGVKTTRWVILSFPRRAGVQRKPRCPLRKTLDSLEPRFRGGDPCATRGQRSAGDSRPVLSAVMLREHREAMRIVFFFQSFGRGRGFVLQIVAARHGLATPPFGKISVVALRAGMHRRRVDRANEALRQLALGRRTSGLHDDLARNVAPVK